MEPVMVLNRKINTRVSSKNVIANPVGVKQSIAVLSFTLLLAACGGDSSSGAKDPELAEGDGTDLIADTFDDLPVCSSKREGATAYVKDEKTAYVCEKGDWTLDGEDPAEKSSSSEKTSSSSGKAKSSSSGDDEALSSSSEGKTGSSSSSDKFTEPAEVTSSSAGDSTGSITCGTMTDSRDGQTYKTVTIGTQTWMAENLNYAYTGSPYRYSGYTSDSSSWCYKDNPANCAKYGRLYTWATAMDSAGTWSTGGKGCSYYTCTPIYPVRGICPEGWHLPTKAEWKTLFVAVGGQSTAGKMLKSTTDWNKDHNGTGAYSFAALPAGSYQGDYIGEGSVAEFWCASESDGDNALYPNYVYLMDILNDARLTFNGNFGRSVRCLQD